MTKKIDVKLILELRASGMSRNEIAATRHMGKHSVSDVIHIAEEQVLPSNRLNLDSRKGDDKNLSLAA